MQKNYFLGILLLISCKFNASEKNSPEININSLENTPNLVASKKSRNSLSSRNVPSSNNASPFSLSNSPEQKDTEETPINPNNTPVDEALLSNRSFSSNAFPNADNNPISFSMYITNKYPSSLSFINRNTILIWKDVMNQMELNKRKK